MRMVRGGPVTISCGFLRCKIIHGVFAWSDYSANECDVRITDEMDMTPLQVSCWRGKFLQQAENGTPSIINLYTMEQSALPTWVSYSFVTKTGCSVQFFHLFLYKDAVGLWAGIRSDGKRLLWCIISNPGTCMYNLLHYVTIAVTSHERHIASNHQSCDCLLKRLYGHLCRST